MSAELAQLQEDRGQYQEQLDLVSGSLSDDPGNAELLALKEELQSALDIIDESVEALKQAEKEAPPPPQKQWQSSKSASYGHKDRADDISDAPVVYKVNESILARWVTGDKAFYPARIMSITGSSTAPMYTVKFKSYDTIETLRARDIKPVAPANPKAPEPAAASTSASTKRKAEDSTESTAPASPMTPAPPAGSPTPVPAVQQPPPPFSSAQDQAYQHPPPPPPPPGSNPIGAPPAPPASASAQPPPPPPQAHRPFGTRTIDRFSAGVVSSAAAHIYAPAAQQQQGQQRPGGFTKIGGGSSSGAPGSGSPAVLGEEPPTKKFKKIKATKQLEAGKSKWQEFSTKGKTTKGVKKDSMFRTPEGVQGRVGFIGSGQAMRKDVTRSRHIYQTNEDLD
ncbi:hypothetical protein F503_00084 [Ophiostoma piceae UAMH 11346]|uniref:Tudor domain-containing protein n=1 Tax=Ophiostoma piceae (strain UAMH 11346) TaxID=1262450 RepID=S3CVW5_OPHP1|nr:hypothetical protein F503_00084 [Ophiostoma piceae UAMH 11346]